MILQLPIQKKIPDIYRFEDWEFEDTQEDRDGPDGLVTATLVFGDVEWEVQYDVLLPEYKVYPKWSVQTMGNTIDATQLFERNGCSLHDAVNQAMIKCDKWICDRWQPYIYERG